MILLIDDKVEFHHQFQKQFTQVGIEIELKCFTTVEQLGNYIEELKSSGNICNLKSLIIDLSNNTAEEISKSFSVASIINETYYNNSIPIFIHSGYLGYYQDFENDGTIIKVKKSIDSVVQICSRIKLMADSGFLDIFCVNGILQQTFFKELHNSFTKQFKGDEITQILESIHHANKENTEVFKERTIDTFKRMAIRSVYQNLISAKRIPTTEKIEEIKINAVEHYYRRSSEFPVWTGDIFRNKETQEDIVILTPRCDINNGYCNNGFLVCSIEKLESKTIKDFGKSSESVGRYINDNPANTGIKFRYLIPAPSYPGGRVNLTRYSIVESNKLHGENASFGYLISLSDELINDIVRKFGSYVTRGGISASELNEATFYSQMLAGSNS